MKRKLKKSRKGKILLVLILIGTGASLLFAFRQEIFDALKPHRVQRRDFPAEKREVLLYFSDSEGEYLVGEKRAITRKEDNVEEEAREAIVELIKGPKGKLISTLPPRTKLLRLRIDEKGVAKVDFSRSLSKEHPGGSSAEIMTVYSIVNSLTGNFPRVKSVQILIEGEAGETVGGHLFLDNPIPPRPDLVKRPAGKPRGS